MTRIIMAGVAAFALMAGAAHAQNVTETTTTTQSVTTPGINPSAVTPLEVAPGVTRGTSADGNFQATTSKRTVHRDGTEVVKKRSYTAGADGTKSSASFRATNPDGTEIKTNDERVTNPDGSSSTTNSTTTHIER